MITHLQDGGNQRLQWRVAGRSWPQAGRDHDQEEGQVHDAEREAVEREAVGLLQGLWHSKMIAQAAEIKAQQLAEAVARKAKQPT